MLNKPGLTNLERSLWSVEAAQKMPGGWVMPARMTVALLSDGSLLLHSPIAVDDALETELRKLGPVSTLVAPNRFHYLHQATTQRRYPDARLYVAPGLEAKLPDLKNFEPLTSDVPKSLRDDFATEVIAGADIVSEVAFFHRASRSLIVTDLVFNVSRPRGILSSLVLFSVGAYKRLAQSRAWRLFVKDPLSYRASLERVLSWPFERIVMAHGDVVDEGARDALTLALRRWNLAVPLLANSETA